MGKSFEEMVCASLNDALIKMVDDRLGSEVQLVEIPFGGDIGRAIGFKNFLWEGYGVVYSSEVIARPCAGEGGNIDYNYFLSVRRRINASL
ncbi:MAG: hypothetical protein V1889_02180 [archaeon]